MFQNRIKKLCQTFTTCILTILLLCVTACDMPIDLDSVVRNYCKEHETIQLKDVIDFEWDVAYIDYYVYGNGEEIKEKYNLDCELEDLDSDNLYRIIFYNGGDFVEEFIVNSGSAFSFDSGELAMEDQMDIFYPDTVFRAVWDFDLLTLEPIQS